MLRSLEIENFRCFQSFELQQLGRLNLLVGTNNSGKTSILEAIQLLTSFSNFESLIDLMLSRGECILNNEQVAELDIRHLFYGHNVDVGSFFSIFGSNDSKGERMVISIEKGEEKGIFKDLQDLIFTAKWLGEEEIEGFKLPLSPKKCLLSDHIKRVRREINSSASKTQFVTSTSLTTKKMIEFFDQIVLTPEEDLIKEALQTIEPNFERIAPVNSEKHKYIGLRSGFLVKFSNSDQRIPIGSMGDGIWRILGLTLAIVNARNGILLVDEIDTGLHFSTMSDMWKLVWETARRLNVQVFATTHSRDCWESLATIANAETPSEEGITIHRIEKGKTKSIVFNERQVVIAAEQEIEVR
ncbi:MAG: AAA family ATPase [Snowella sp.]|nr:AAA family ATPase [Snowella sp.]